MTKLQTNRVLIVLDRSSSMSSMRQEAIAGINEQIKTLKEESDASLRTYVSIFTFASDVDEPLLLNASVEDLFEFTERDYVPGGMTAMLDAVGAAIDSQATLADIDDENTSFIVTIISDGQENNSKKYNNKSLAEKVEVLQKTDRWTFTYLGANQDLATVARNTSIPLSNMSSFNATASGYGESTSCQTDSLKNFYSARRGGAKSVTDFYDKKDVKNKKDKKKSKPDSAPNLWS